MLPGRRRLSETLLGARWAFIALIFTVVVVFQVLQLLLIQPRGAAAVFVTSLLFYGVTSALVVWWAMTVLARDLGQRERTKEEARKREQYLASVLEESADAILSLDTAGVIQS